MNLDRLPPGRSSAGQVEKRRYIRSVWLTRTHENGYMAEMVFVQRSWPDRLYRWIVRWEPCETFWGSHGCDKREGHFGRHRCGGIIRDRCGYGYLAPPWWALWREDKTEYFS